MSLPINIGVNLTPNLTSPNTCGILGLLNKGKAFASAVLGNAIALQAQLMSTASQLLNLPNVLIGIGLGTVQALASRLIGMANHIAGSCK